MARPTVYLLSYLHSFPQRAMGVNCDVTAESRPLTATQPCLLSSQHQIWCQRSLEHYVTLFTEVKYQIYKFCHSKLMRPFKKKQKQLSCLTLDTCYCVHKAAIDFLSINSCFTGSDLQEQVRKISRAEQKNSQISANSGKTTQRHAHAV